MIILHWKIMLTLVILPLQKSLPLAMHLSIEHCASLNHVYHSPTWPQLAAEVVNAYIRVVFQPSMSAVPLFSKAAWHRNDAIQNKNIKVRIYTKSRRQFDSHSQMRALLSHGWDMTFFWRNLVNM